MNRGWQQLAQAANRAAGARAAVTAFQPEPGDLDCHVAAGSGDDPAGATPGKPGGLPAGAQPRPGGQGQAASSAAACPGRGRATRRWPPSPAHPGGAHGR
jgi:hypothetical protein